MVAPDLSREQWLALRRQSIGASEAAAACGEDPIVSPLELVARKRGVMPDVDLSAIEAVRWGNLLEPVIVAETVRRAELAQVADPREIESLFADDRETELVGWVEGRQAFLRSRHRPWQTATLDGIARGSDGALFAIEAKNCGQYHSAAWDAEEGRTPEKFQLQVAHQLAVAPRLSAGILSGLVGGNSLRFVRLERVKIVQVIEALVAIEGSIWNCIATDTLPALSGPPASVTRALKALHPEDSGQSVVLPDALVQVARDLERMKAERKDAEDLIEELGNRIRAALGGSTFGVLPDGSGEFSFKTQDRAGYVVQPGKSRVLRFSKTKASKATTRK